MVGIKRYFSATGVRQWLSIIWSRSSGFIHIEWTTPREAITWLQSLFFDCATFMTIRTSGQNLKSNLLTATWWLGQYTNSLADAEQFGHLLGVVVAGWHEWQNAQRELCFNSSLWRVQNYFSQLRWKVSKMSQLYPAKINFFNVQSQNRPLFCFSVLVPETNTVVACLKIKFLFRSWLQKTVNSKCLIKNILCAKLLTLKQTITWSQDVYPE